MEHFTARVSGASSFKKIYIMILYTFLAFFVAFHDKVFILIVFISFLDKLLNFRNRILTNQKRELMVSNCQRICYMDKLSVLLNFPFMVFQIRMLHWLIFPLCIDSWPAKLELEFVEQICIGFLLVVMFFSFWFVFLANLSKLR